MNPTRLSLLIGLFGVGIVLFMAISFGQKLDRELQATRAIALQNKQLSEQLQASVAELKASNEQQTDYIQCLLAAQHVTKFGSIPSCVNPAPGSSAQKPITQPAPAAAPSRSSPQSSPQSSPSPQPTPNPASSIIQTITKLIKAL